jgi:hypothetical protein
MKLPQGYKFIQEAIFEGIWPLSRLKSPYSVMVMSFIYMFAGIGLYIMFSLPITFLIAGTSAGIGISVWTYGIFQYANRLREAEIVHMTSVKRKLLSDFLEEMFHDRSLFIGLMGFVAVLAYFWTSSEFYQIDNIFDVIQKETGTALHPFVLAYSFIIVFDICYRFGLSAYISIVLLKRNHRIAKLLQISKFKKQITPRDLLELERVDRYHLLSFASGIFFLPMSIFDPFLFACLTLYLFFSSLATIMSILQLRTLHAKAIPDEVIELLSSCQLAYIGNSSNQHVPHVTPTLYVFDGRRVFFATSIKSQKVRNLFRKKDVAVCLHYESPKNFSKNRGVLIRGWARVYGHNILTAIFYVLVHGVKMLHIKILYHRKYEEYVRYYKFKAGILPGPWRLTPILSRTIVEVIPYQYTYWEGTKFTRTVAL